MADYTPKETLDSPLPETPGSAGNEGAPAPSPAAEEAPRLTLSEKIAKRVEKVQKEAPSAPAPAAKETLGTQATGETAAKKQAPVAGTGPETPPLAAATGETPPPATFAPDFKFKFTDEKGQKMEADFPDFLKASVTTKEQEDELRTIMAKSKGLDFIKPRFDHLRTRYQELNNAHGIVTSSIDELRQHVGRNDFDSFFARLQIPQEKVLQWVLEKVNYAELPPEQRAVQDSRKQAEQRAWEAEQRLQSLEGQSFGHQVQAKQVALDSCLTRPEINSIVNDFDSRTSPGAFREAVRRHGEWKYFSTNGQVDLSPDQAIQEVLANLGLTPKPNTAPTPATAQSAAAATVATSPAPGANTSPPSSAPTVIPNINGKAQSPAAGKKGPRSIAELKKLGQEMAQA